MSTDTPTTAQLDILDDLIDQHNTGLHQNSPSTGCAGCLLSGALEGVGE